MQPLRTLLALTLTAGGALAQAGGFTDGDLVLATRALTGNGSQDGGLVTIDPASGQAQTLLAYDSFASYGRGVLAFDSFRKRLVVHTALDQGGPVYGLWTVDASGAVELLHGTTQATSGLAPTGDGRLYVLTPGDTAAAFHWYDGANRRHVLLDETGGAPFGFSGIYNHNDSVLTYDPGTNALFVAYRGSSGPACPGAAGGGTTIRKLPLSADGTRVVGPVSCLEVQGDPVQSSEVPANWSRGPAGELVLVIDTPGLSSAEKPRVMAVDPVAFSASPFATPGGFPGADQLTAGCWSPARGELLLLDTLHDDLRTYGPGEVGPGSLLGVGGTVSATPGSGELATLVSVDNGPCAGGVQALGVGLAGAGGQVPALLAGGCAQVGQSLSLSLRDVVGGAFGLLLFGVAEGQLPFRGGTLFMAGVDLTQGLTVGGTPGVPGAGALDLPPVLLSLPTLAGHSVLVQGAFQDGAAVQGVSLTQALRLEIE